MRERELVADRHRVYELNGEDSRTLAALGTFRVVPEQDLDIAHDTLGHLQNERLVETVDLATNAAWYSRRKAATCSTPHTLAFAERILPRASDLWVQASLDYKQRLQQLFFPEGIAFDGNRFNRTAVTAPFFKYLATGEKAEESLASPAEHSQHVHSVRISLPRAA